MSQEKELPWFMQDISHLSDKTRALAEIMRRGYEAEQLPPEQREREAREAIEWFRQHGAIIRDYDDEGDSGQTDDSVVQRGAIIS